MVVKIRLKRIGRKHKPCYRIVAADARSPRDGRFLETLGTYDPLKEGKNYTVKRERVLYWLGVGAQVSEAVAPFLKKEGISIGKKKRGGKAAKAAKAEKSKKAKG